VQYTSSVTKSYISSPNYCTPPVAPPPSGASYIEPALYTGQGVAVNADGINGGGSYSFSGLDQESCAWNWAGQGTAPANLEVGVAPSALIEVMTPGGFSGSASITDTNGPNWSDSAPGIYTYPSGLPYFLSVPVSSNVATLVVPVNYTLSVSDSNFPILNGYVTAIEKLNATPISIILTGTTVDKSGGVNILVGQGCIATLSGLPPLPTGFTWSLTWSASGTTLSGDYISPGGYVDEFGYQYYVPYGEEGYPVYTYPAFWQTLSPHWYWNDNGGYWGSSWPETVGVTANVLNASGATVDSVSLSTTVNVWAPTASISSAQGAASVTGTDSSGNLDNLGSAADNDSGFTYYAAIVSPKLFDGGPGLSGTVEDYQLANIYYEVNDIPATTTLGEYELDLGSGAQNLYYSIGSALAAANPSGESIIFSDSPFKTTGTSVDEIGSDSSFQDYIEYLPPGSDSILVPTYYVNWNWIATAEQEGGAVGLLNPSCTSMTGYGYCMTGPAWYNDLTL
jgi:hypothetical protein